MGRLFAILLGGASLALFIPILLPDQLSTVTQLWTDLLGPTWYPRVVGAGPGIFAGLALVLLAVRGRD